MGNSIASAMVEKQKEMQKEMMEKQIANQLRAQERMKRMQIAMSIAMTRERLWWQAGFGTFVLLGLGAYSHKNGFPKPAVLPVAAYATVMAYQYDFAYGTKPDRINKMCNELLSDPNNWFVPVFPDENDPALDIKPDPTKKATVKK